MRYAIISDVHGRQGKLEAVVADAQRRGAESFISLGDVGGDGCLELLHSLGAAAVFGNYEVSGWTRHRDDLRAWVRSWPPLLVADTFLGVHAAPTWPRDLSTVEGFGNWLRRTGRSWRALFPYMSEDEKAVWASLAELESQGKAVLFHGHTHRQSVWRWSPGGRLQKVLGHRVCLEDGHRYVVGAGSAGLPEDGAWATYALYDTQPPQIEFVRLDRRQKRIVS